MQIPPPRGSAFVGRWGELARLDGILAAVGPGNPRIVLIEGPPGIGKTTLVDRFLESSDTTRVVRASGEEYEALVPFGVVDQLLRVTSESRPELLPARRPTPRPDDHVGVGMRVLQLLGELNEQRPVAVVIDDLQWVDSSSLRARCSSRRAGSRPRACCSS